MLLKLTRELRARDFSQCVVSLMDEGEVGHQLERLAIPVHCLDMKHGRPSWRAIRRLSAIIGDYRPDIIQGWMYHANLAANIAAGRKVPVVWGVRQSLYELNKTKLSTRLVITAGRLLARYSNRIVYNSVTGARQHEDFGYPSSKTVVIANGFDVEKFRPNPEGRTQLRRELGLCDSDVVIGNVARYDPLKNHSGLIQAFANIAAQYPNVHLVLAGSGVDPSNTVLADNIGSLGVDRQVHLIGRRSNIARLMSGLDLYVSPSTGEGFPNVIGEAMACGVPCVATDVGDSRSIIAETGWIVQPGNLTELARSMRLAIDLPAKRREELGSRARERIRKRYAMSSIGDAFETLYRAVCMETNRRRTNVSAT